MFRLNHSWLMWGRVHCDIHTNPHSRVLWTAPSGAYSRSCYLVECMIDCVGPYVDRLYGEYMQNTWVPWNLDALLHGCLSNYWLLAWQWSGALFYGCLFDCWLLACWHGWWYNCIECLAELTTHTHGRVLSDSFMVDVWQCWCKLLSDWKSACLLVRCPSLGRVPVILFGVVLVACVAECIVIFIPIHIVECCKQCLVEHIVDHAICWSAW